MYRPFAIAACLLIATTLPATAQHNHTSKYAGEQSREIKSLSPDDLTQLRSGAGWGLAKAAELNGVPGPAHLLEMKSEINLSADQVRDITAQFDEMQAAAIEKGEALIELEKQLETGFVNRSIDQASLKNLLDKIGAARAELRFVHLSAHLKTPAILTEHQITLYNRLRGYADDPCANVPAGHNAEMWKKHNGCE